MRIHSRVTILVATGMLVMSSACSTFLTRPLSDAADTTMAFPNQVRLTLRNGDIITVKDARRQRDSIVGTLERNDDTKVRPPVAVAISDVTRYEKFNDTGKALRRVAVIGGAIVALFAVAIASLDFTISDQP